MSRSEIIDRLYRLTPADLNGRPRQVVIKGVTLEGVEFTHPLLHFEGVARPMALDLTQRTDMAVIARSTLLADWIGISLVLRPIKTDGQEAIALQPIDVQETQAPIAWKPKRDAPTSSLRALFVMLALLLMAFAAVFIIENTDFMATIVDFFQR